MYLLYLPFPFILSSLAGTNHCIYCHQVIFTLTHLVIHQEINITSSLYHAQKINLEKIKVAVWSSPEESEGPKYIRHNYVQHIDSSPNLYIDIYHSYKRRKLSADTLQEIIDNRAIDLEDFDIDDSDRTLPPHVFDIDGTYYLLF